MSTLSRDTYCFLSIFSILIQSTPCLDDNQQRELILKNKPSYEVLYDKVNNSPKEGESLYFIKYKFKYLFRKDKLMWKTFTHIDQNLKYWDINQICHIKSHNFRINMISHYIYNLWKMSWYNYITT